MELLALVAAAAYVLQLPVKGLLATSGAMAIVVSPIVFLGFITAGQFNSSSQTFLVLALFAFQNGFFWQTVLKRSPADALAPAADQAR